MDKLPKRIFAEELPVLILLAEYAKENAVTALELSAHSDPKLAPVDIARIATSLCIQRLAVLKPGGNTSPTKLRRKWRLVSGESPNRRRIRKTRRKCWPWRRR